MKEWVNSDSVMINLLQNVLIDFQTLQGSTYHKKLLDILISRGIEDYRAYKFPARSQAPPYLFKMEYQLENFFKRYTFEKDVLSTEERQRLTIEKFVATQSRISVPYPVTPLVHKVLQRTRLIISEILGVYRVEEHQEFSGFGKRACIGVPFRNAYLHKKMENPTGTDAQIVWFQKNLENDALLRQSVESSSSPELPKFRSCDISSVSLVPKNFKSMRLIRPPSSLGAFYTKGLGDLITSKLKSVGLDLRTLQDKHRYLARKGSIDRHCVTADLSSASDSITVQLIRTIFPRKWARAILFGRIRYASIKGCGERLQLQSPLLMGDGHTFPVQTLVFYSLLKAIAELGKVGGKISVFGDDLIYPFRLHRYVKVIFPLLHLQLNMDKTYANDYFRESCGGDYCRGLDVRPFQFEGGHQRLQGRKLQSFLYRLYNGLSRRWELCELPNAFSYLREEMKKHGKIHQVPSHYPDGAGIKCDTFQLSEEYHVPRYNLEIGMFCFPYVYEKRKKVDFKGSQLPYYWEALRQKSVQSLQRIAILSERRSLRETVLWSFSLTDEIFALLKDLNPELFEKEKQPTLSWRKLKTFFWTKGWKGRVKERRLVSTLVSRNAGQMREMEGQTSSWALGA